MNDDLPGNRTTVPNHLRSPRCPFNRWIGCSLWWSALLILLVAALPGCGGIQSGEFPQTEVWRFAIEESEGSVQHAYATEFKRRIEQATGGRVQVLVYPYGTLGTSTQITEQLNMGALEFAMASPGSLGKFIPELQAFLLHFLFPESAELTRQLLSDPELIAAMDRLYAPKGLKLMSLFSEGEMVWTLKREVRSPQDFRGLKMRVMTSPLLLSAYAAYGASPTPMPYSEVYSGLQLNMIDGQVNPIFAIERQKFHEVTTWMIFPGHASFITTCAANRKFIDTLDPEHQLLVKQVIMDLDAFIFEVQRDLQTNQLKQILKDKQLKNSELNICGDREGLTQSWTAKEIEDLVANNPTVVFHPALTEAEREQFRQASETVFEKYLQMGGDQGAETLARIRQLADRLQGRTAPETGSAATAR